jgi:hypothetical protein
MCQSLRRFDGFPTKNLVEVQSFNVEQVILIQTIFQTVSRVSIVRPSLSVRKTNLNLSTSTSIDRTTSMNFPLPHQALMEAATPTELNRRK